MGHIFLRFLDTVGFAGILGVIFVSEKGNWMVKSPKKGYFISGTN
jgi:hypothetical protein